MIVSFVNGIYHSPEDWRNLTVSLSDVFGDRVRAFYNPSSGTAFFNWIQDAARAGYELVRRPNDLELAKRLAEHLRSALGEVGPTGRVLHLAHSGGAILTYLAAKYHLTTQETDRIDLATFGGGRSMTRKYFKGRVVNYYARNDPLTMVDGRAGALMRHAKKTDNNTFYTEVRDRKHNTTFVYLHGIADNPLVDHSMFGPTYERALRMEAENFRARLLRLNAAVTVVEASWLRRARKRTAKMTGMRHFWGNSAAVVQANVRVVRKRAARVTNKRGFFSKKLLIESALAATNISVAVSREGEGEGSGEGAEVVANNNKNSTSSLMTRSAQGPPAAPASWREAVAQRARSTLRRMYPAGPSSSEPFLEEQQQLPESTSWAGSDLSIVRRSSPPSLSLPLPLAAKASLWARESIVSAKTAASQLRQGASQWLGGGGGNKRTAAPHPETASYSQRLLSGATQRFAQLKLLVARRGQSDAPESLPPPPPPSVLEDGGEPLAAAAAAAVVVVVVDSVAPAEEGTLETTAAAAAATTSDQGEQTADDEAVLGGTGEQQLEATTPLMNPGDVGQEREREREADAATEPTAVAEGVPLPAAEADELPPPKEAEPELAQANELEPSSQQAE